MAQLGNHSLPHGDRACPSLLISARRVDQNFQASKWGLREKSQMALSPARSAIPTSKFTVSSYLRAWARVS